MRFLLLPLLAACSAPDGSGFFTKMDVRVVEDEVAASLEFIPVIEGAEDTLRIALPRATYLPLAEAIIEAHARRVDVKVVTDIDQRDDQGIQALVDAGVPIRFNDDAVTYFDFGFNQDVVWSSDQVVMSHAFVVADRTQIVNATSVGGEAFAEQVVFQLTGEDIGDDLTTEHNQLFGGSDASALTAYSAQAKSRADPRDIYATDSDAPVEIYFGPQQRLTKRVIDGIYTARTSVRVLSNDIANAGINRALQDKAGWGFNVEAIVGPGFGGQGVARGLTRETPDVSKLRFEASDDVPTIVLIDIEGGLNSVPRAYVLSHDLYSAARFFGTTEITTDQLIDGNLLLLHDKNYVAGEDPESALQVLVDLYFDHQARSGAF